MASYVLGRFIILRKKQYNNDNNIITRKEGHELHFKWLDARIIEELLSDAYISSTDISKRHKAPLSTVQRRRRYLENTVLSRRYEIDLKKHGFRIGEITVHAEDGVSRKIADEILSKYRKNIFSISIKIDGSVILTVFVYFKTTDEIHHVMEGILSIPLVQRVSFAETVEIMRTKTARIGETLLSFSSFNER
jgi:DNA-binding Lrp family transcriptional regulator